MAKRNKMPKRPKLGIINTFRLMQSSQRTFYKFAALVRKLGSDIKKASTGKFGQIDNVATLLKLLALVGELSYMMDLMHDYTSREIEYQREILKKKGPMFRKEEQSMRSHLERGITRSKLKRLRRKYGD